MMDLKTDMLFVSQMAAKYPCFSMPSWYWRPETQSFSDFEAKRKELSMQRGHYEGIGIAGNKSYHFYVPLLQTDACNIATIEFSCNGRVVNVREVHTDKLFEELEAYIHEASLSL